MGKRLSIEEKLSAIRRLRERQPCSEVAAELRSALRDRSNLIVAAAAAIVGDQKHVELSPDLEAAFERFLVDPRKSDKLCRAKIAIVGALDKLEHERPDTFLVAARHVQMEPVWGGQEDAAVPCALPPSSHWRGLTTTVYYRCLLMRSSIRTRRSGSPRRRLWAFTGRNRQVCCFASKRAPGTTSPR